MESNGLPGKHISLWMDTTERTAYPSLSENATCDVAVLGGGLAGLTAAHLLAEAGQQVVLVEAAQIASGVSGFTTGKITSLHTLIYKDLIDRFGKDKAKLYGESNQWAIGHIASTVAGHDIDCDFVRDDAYTYALTEDGLQQVQDEVDAALELSLPATFVDESKLPFLIRGAIRFDNQARFHPRKYLLKLAEIVAGLGGRIYEQTRACKVEEHDSYVEVQTESGTITAGYALVLTHFPFHDQAMYFSRLYPQRSYALAARVAGSMTEGMHISADEPERSVRRAIMDGEEVLIFGGEVHKTGEEEDTQKRYLAVADWARQNWDVQEFLYHWSTQDNKTMDGVPYVGRATKGNHRVFMASGFDGWGMTGCTMAGKLLTDLVLGIENPWEVLYDPNRSEIKGTGTFLSENLDVAKHLVGDKLKGGEDIDPAALGLDEGRVIKWNGDTVAAYKDPGGSLHVVSASCTHMGCVLHWNTAEKSWDCPCHGSRFGIDGAVLHGPAIKNLEKRL